MKKCLKCGKEFEPSKGLVNYCSLQCRNSKIFTEEAKEKKRNKTKEAWNNGVYIESRALMNYKESGKKSTKTWNDKLLKEDFNSLKFGRLKKRVVLEQNGKCNKCGLNEWLGEKLVLELEHKDGNHNNDSRENLECLCPNCHSLTTTWRGRNKFNKLERGVKVTDEDIIKELQKSKNIRQCLINLKLSPKGGNYKRINKVIKMSNMVL